MTTWKLHVERGLGQAWPARVSVPCPRGTQPPGFAVHTPEGITVPAQHRVLTHWPDGSPRWVQLDFQATQAGEHLAIELCAPGVPRLPVTATAAGPRWEVTVGRLALAIAPGESSPLARLAWDGRELSAGGWSFVAVDEQGREYPLAPGPAAPRVEAQGAHRFQLAWELDHADQLLRARLRLEVLAGIEGFSLSYQFFHLRPGCPELRLTRLTARCAFPGLAAGEVIVGQQYQSNLGLRRYVHLHRPVTLRLDHTRYGTYVPDPATELDDPFDYPPFLAGTNQAMDSVVALADHQVAVLAAVRELETQRPKTLRVEPGLWAVDIWPPEAGLLRLPQGRSNRQVFCFRFLPHQPEAVEALLYQPTAVAQEPALVWLDTADSVHAGPTWDQPRLFTGSEPGAAYFSRILQDATQRYNTVARMFDHGDVPDTGYTVSYPPTGRAPGNPHDLTFATNQTLHPLFHHPHELEPVWTNNEYDAIYCLALELLRTRTADTRRRLVAAARHQLEVDFVHYSDHWQQHRATPQHSYHHTTLMSAIPSHQWTQGLYYYYALTGDDDALEVIRGICDFNLTFLERDELGFALFFNRELGWALVALVCGYEVTADERYLEFSRKIIHKLEQDAGRTDFSGVLQKTGTLGTLNATGLGLGFCANTIPLGLKLYHQATGEAWARDLLLHWVAYGMTNFNRREHGHLLTELFPESLTYAVELTGNPRYLEESLWQLRLFFVGHTTLGWLDGMSPLTTKLYARMYRGLIFLLSALAQRGYLPDLEAALIDVPFTRRG